MSTFPYVAVVQVFVIIQVAVLLSGYLYVFQVKQLTSPISFLGIPMAVVKDSVYK